MGSERPFEKEWRDFQRRSFVEIESPREENRSTLEAIPREIVWMIMEQVPEAIDQLRLTSRLLRSHVDAYSILRNIDVVKLKLFAPDMKFSTDGPRLLIKTTITDKILFKRKINICLPHSYIQQLSIVRCESDMITWRILFDKLFENETLIETFAQCLGRRIGKITLYECSSPFMLKFTSTLLKGITFKHLKIVIMKISDDYKNYLFELIKQHNVEKFSLYTDKITANYPVKVLFNLSSLVRSLHIHQQFTRDIQIGDNYLLGIKNADWTAIILEMFTRKLDKLWIENSLYKGYLSHEGFRTLKEKLPLIDKKIWFNASISPNLFLTGSQKERNGNIVKVGSSEFATTFEVRHKSRKHEIFDN